MTLTDPHASVRADIRASLADTAPGVSPLVTWALTHLDHVSPLTTAERLILTTLALAAEVDLRTGGGYNGQTADTIAHMTGMSEDRGLRAVRGLLRRGLLVTSSANEYVIRLPEEAFNH